MSNLMSKLLKAGTIKANVLSDDSDVLNCRDVTPTSIPIINAAFTGDLFTGGVVSGVSVFAGPSKHFKTTLALLCLKSYLDKYEDSICLFYDNEFGATLESFNDLGIDLNRVVHIPITSIEELRSDISNRLNEIQPGDKVFTLIDSLGNLASKKEIKDAIEDKDAADMTRAKVIKSLFRIITPHFTLKNIPAIVISHVYLTMELFCLHGDTQIKTINGPVPIKDISINDMVYTINNELTKVLATYKRSKELCKDKEFMQLEFDDGSIVKCTHDHKFLTSDDIWKSANELDIGDILK